MGRCVVRAADCSHQQFLHSSIWSGSSIADLRKGGYECGAARDPYEDSVCATCREVRHTYAEVWISALQGGDSSGNPATGGSLESASSSDMQIVSLQMVVNYRIATGTTPKLWSTVGAGYEDNVIQPAVHESTKAAVAQFSATDLIGKREEVRAKIEEFLKAKLISYNIVVEQVSIVNLDFSKQFNDAIEAKVTAEQLKDKAVNDLARIQVEAQQRVADAQGQRDAAIAAAEGQAKATMLTAEADAKKVELINQQLARSPQYIEYIKASRWSGNYPQFYMTGGSSPNLLMSLPAVSASS